MVPTTGRAAISAHLLAHGGLSGRRRPKEPQGLQERNGGHGAFQWNHELHRNIYINQGYL